MKVISVCLPQLDLFQWRWVAETHGIRAKATVNVMMPVWVLLHLLSLQCGFVDCRTLFQVRNFFLWFSKSGLCPFTTPICIPLGCSCEAQKLSRLSPSECPKFIWHWVSIAWWGQHRLWFQKVSFNAVAPLSREHSDFHRECCATFPSFSVCRRVSCRLFGLWLTLFCFSSVIVTAN